MKSKGVLRMILLVLVGVAAATLGATGVAAQTVRGQFLFSHGDLPNEPVGFYLSSTDGRVNELRYSDSNGRFILERLSGQMAYTIEVTGDGRLYGNTSYEFYPSRTGVIRVTLNPPAPKKGTPPGTVSAASGYRPKPEAEELHDAAMKDVEQEKWDAAETKLRKAIEKDPQFLAPVIDLGALLMQEKKYPEAEQVLRRALAVDAKSYLALLILGTALNHQDKFAEGVPFLREALRLQPGLVAGHLQLGIALVETDKFAEAEKELQRAVAGGSEEIAGQLYLGKLYARTGDFAKGVAALENYLRKAPNASNAGEVKALIERMKKEMAARG